MEKPALQLDAESINQMYDAIGALVFATAMQLSPEQRRAFAQQLARLAQSKNRAGSTIAGSCLLDFARAAEFAAENG